MTQNLTPFEIAQLGRIDSSIIYSIAGSTAETVERVLEAEIQVDAYRSMLKIGEQPDEEERAITGEAMKEMREAQQKLISMANILEEKYNISA